MLWSFLSLMGCFGHYRVKLKLSNQRFCSFNVHKPPGTKINCRF